MEPFYDELRQLLIRNMEEGKVGALDYHYTKPSPERYPYQFFWDTCFHVFILCSLGEYTMAKSHLKSLFQLQEKSGFVGHMIFWDKHRPQRITDFFQSKPRWRHFNRSHMSALIQPPMAAQALERIYQETGDKAYLNEMYPKVKKYYQWLATHRDFDGDGLLTIITSFESGMDWKPTFDPVINYSGKTGSFDLFARMIRVDIRNFIRDYNLKKIYNGGYFLVKESGFNSIYIENLHALSALAAEAGDHDAETIQKRAIQAANSIFSHMFDKEHLAFYDINQRDRSKIRIKTPTIFFPLLWPDFDRKLGREILEANYFNSDNFKVKFPIPSVSVNDPSFDPGQSDYIWRGPTWMLINWYMFRVFRKYGYHEEADRILKSSQSLIKLGGFREYYNPYTGEGYGAKDFTWSGLLVDMMEIKKKQKEYEFSDEKK